VVRQCDEVELPLLMGVCLSLFHIVSNWGLNSTNRQNFGLKRLVGVTDIVANCCAIFAAGLLTLLNSEVVIVPHREYEVGTLAVDGWAVTFGTVRRVAI